MHTRLNNRILVGNADSATRERLDEAISRSGFEVEHASDAHACLVMLKEREYDCFLVDVELGAGQSGLELCARVAESRPDVPVVVMTGHNETDAAIGAIRAGAYDFMTKPLSGERLDLVLDRAVAHKRLTGQVEKLQQEYEESRPVEGLVGDSQPMQEVFDLIKRVSATDVSVLVTGESGTGKELVARAIHDRSARSSGPFVAINCAAVPATLLESELFGHAKGAFTDAKQGRGGLFVEATGGTLFLDEIGDMSPDLQVRLLRTLQEHRVRPVGGDEEIEVDARIIAATNSDLDAEVNSGDFRDDLYYRINVVRIDMPPLRNRGTDILALAEAFLERIHTGQVSTVRGISPDAQRMLLEYSWPGNVRELENAIERAVALTRSDVLRVEDLPSAIRDHRCTRVLVDGRDADKVPTLEEFAKRYIYRVLEAVNGNKSQASKVLGMDRRTLYRRLDRLEAAEASDQ